MSTSHRIKSKQVKNAGLKQAGFSKNRLNYKTSSTNKTHQKNETPSKKQASFKKPLQAQVRQKDLKSRLRTSSIAQTTKKFPGKLHEKLAHKLVSKTRQKKSVTPQPKDSQYLETIEKYKKELEQFKKEILYQKAEFENHKKRTITERTDLLKYRSEQLAIEMLEVVDTFERALSFKIEPQNLQSFADGMKMVYSSFIKALKTQGIEQVPVLGKAFDPHLCDALSKESTNNVPAGHVSQVIKKPYKLYEKIIRFGQVVVAQEPASPPKTSQKNNQAAAKTPT